MIASYIDVIGQSSISVFFALYVTHRFGVGMTQAGALLALFSVAGMIGSTIGGALTDHLGRRNLIIFGLVASAVSSLSLAAVPTLEWFYPAALVAGLFSSIGGPARGAMIADLLPEERRPEGFGILRVAANLAWLTGPMLSGILAAQSYLLIFILDAVVSSISAVIVVRFIPETHARRIDSGTSPRLGGLTAAFTGYGRVLRDARFLLFLVPCILALLGYRQSYATLTVFLRDVHSLSEQGIGLIFSLDAVFVVCLQFWFMRAVRGKSPFLMMALGSALYAVGLSLFGFVSAYGLFIAARLTVAMGEMILMPIGQSVASIFAPEDMRGRYMAVYGLVFGGASALAPLIGGLVLDNYDPRLRLVRGRSARRTRRPRIPLATRSRKAVPTARRVTRPGAPLLTGAVDPIELEF